MDDSRFIKISLDDTIIKAMEGDEERLRFSITIGGKEVLLKFPVYGMWDEYLKDMAKLMMILARTAQDIQLNIELIPENYFPQWAYVVSEVLLLKQCRELVEHIFFKYLQPEIKDVEDVKEHMAMNTDARIPFYMFTSIMQVDSWFKKKSIEIVQKSFPNLILPSSKATLQKNSTSNPTNSTDGLHYEFF